MSTRIQKRPRQKRDMSASEFIALPDTEKNRIVAEFDASTPGQRWAKSRPLNAKERAQWVRMKKKMKAGRPRMGENGVEKVSVSVEKSLLKQADAYAKQNKLNRSELFSKGLRSVILAAAPKN